MGVLCGVDIIEIERIAKSFKELGNDFRDRIFTEKEIEYCESKMAGRYKSYAARFAAKEAVSKALGTGIGEKIGWKDIEVLSDESGKPYVRLSCKGRDLLEAINAEGISLSLSHCNDYAVAYAVIELKGKT